jgi:hypothetical protein
MMGRSNKQANEAKAPLGNEADTSGESIDEALIAGASAMTDIENMIGELQDARDYLRGETERVMQANARYAHLARTASASVRAISESMGRWRNTSAQIAPPALVALDAPETQPKMSEE